MNNNISMLSPYQKSMLPLVLAGGIIVLAGGLAYSNSLHGAFIFDDLAAIPDNPTIRHLWPIGSVLSPPCSGETVSGRPILNLSFALNYALSGTNVWSYHVTNLAIHLLNGLLLLGILRRTFLLPSLRPKFGSAALLLSSVIALLWVIHPLQTEAVTYIVQRAESLATLFYLLVLYAVIRGVQGRTTLWFVIAVAACCLGVASKEIVATAPVMALLYDRTLLAGTFRQALRQRWKLYSGLATSWALLIGLILQRGFVTRAVVGLDTPETWWCHDYTQQRELIWSYACSQPGVILYYLRQSVWPHPLCLAWDWPIAKTWSAMRLPALVVAMLLTATIWALLRGSNGIIRAWGLLGAGFFLILAPTSSVVPLGDLAYEHRMYLPLAAVIILLVVSAYLVGQRWIVRGRLITGLCLVSLVAVVLGVLTFQRNQDYHSVQSIWEDTVNKCPYSPVNHYNYGVVLLVIGQPQESIEHFQQALRLKPDYAEARHNLGSALAALGQLPEAVKCFEQAARLNPDYFDAQYNWGTVLSMLGRPSEAIEHFQQAVRIKSNDAATQNGLGDAYMALNQPAEAVSHYERALQIHPDYKGSQGNWGAALSMLGRWAEAAEHFKKAIQSEPNAVDIQTNFCIALLHMGKIHEAIAHAREIAQRIPDNPRVLQTAAWLLATHDSTEGGDGAEAVKLAQRACQLTQRKDTTCLDTLAMAYAAAGRFDEAIATAQETVQLAQAAGLDILAEKINAQMQLYRNRKPYRESE